MDCCIFCSSELDEETSPEHILLRSLGGRKITNRVICNKCNNDFGSGIDMALARSVEPIRNIGGFKSGNRRSAPAIRNIEIDGEKFDLLPGAVPILRITKKIDINPLPDGKTELSIKANNEEEFVQLLDEAASKLKITGDKAEKFKSDALVSATLHSTPSPEFEFQTTYGDIDSQRSMAKACLVLWADSVGTDEVLQSRYQIIREFIREKKISDAGGEFISIDTRPVPKFNSRFGANPNIVWVGSNYHGRVLGYFRLYGILGWKIELARDGAPADQSFHLISNPESPSNWSNSSNEADILSFAWVEEGQEEFDFNAIKINFGKLLKNSHDRAFDGLLSDIVNEAFKESGAEEGELLSKKQKEGIAKHIAWKATHALMKLPYKIPLNLNKRSN